MRFINFKTALTRLSAAFCLIMLFMACKANNDSPANTQGGDGPDTQQAKVGDVSTDDSTASDGIPPGAKILLEVYPDCIKAYKDGYLVMANGERILYDDGRKKSFVQLLDEADPEDMFAFTYDVNAEKPGYRQDAGRSRCDKLFMAMYGHSAAEVNSRLVKVQWIGETVRFTNVNGAADSLRAVARELASHPEYKQYLKSSGSFVWRTVRGAKRMSAHSFGMTIDVGVPVSNYWQWDSKTQSETVDIKYNNRFPLGLVKIFEKHGFIWGGRWYHYDTMHFEFRPEILRTVK